MDAAGSTAEAVAVLGDTVVAVGRDDAVRPLAGPGTRVVCLGGGALLPGFYDAHGHFPASGLSGVQYVDLNSPPMGPIEAIDEILEALRRRAAHTPAGEWVLGRGYDDSLVAEGRHPNRTDLDRVSTEHPILIRHVSGHFSAANTAALDLAGISGSTPDPAGGVIRREAGSRHPDGVLEETATGAVQRLIPPLDDPTWVKGLSNASGQCVSRGVTTAVIAGCNAQALSRLHRAIGQGLLPIGLVCMTGRGGPGKRSILESTGLHTGFGGPQMSLGAIKMFQDGSIQGFTGYLTRPYHTPFMGDPEYRGYPVRSRSDLTTMVREAHASGNQIAIHGNGDAAIDDILDAYSEALRDSPRPDARHRIEHCQMAREDQLDRMEELGITPSFFVQHTYYWGDRHRRIFMGPERAAKMSPLHSALDRGIRFTLHNDSPVTPINPLFSAWSAVNRLTRSGHCVGESERIGAEQALRALTIDAAWQNFEEDEKGSIEVGKQADLVILDRDPVAAPPRELRHIQALETIVRGRSVYRHRSASP